MIGAPQPTLFMAHPPGSPESPHGNHPPRHFPSPRRGEVEAWIGRHPVACVAAALFAGAMLGWFLKRR